MINTVEVKNLSKDYGEFKLEDVSFSLPKGTVTGLIGENGAGKTTIIKSILGLIRKDKGLIKLWDQELSEENSFLKENIGVVLDDIKFYGEMTPRQAEKVLKKAYTNWDSDLYEKYLKEFKIRDNTKIKDLSRGMKMKLQIALALAHHPKLLIFDEATSGLDPVMRDDLLEILYDFIQDEENTILISSHNITDLEKIADYILFIHDGSVVFDKPKEKITEEMGIVRCGEEELEDITRENIIAYKANPHSLDVLVNNIDEVKRKNPGLTVDRADIDEIMLIYLKGQRL